MDGHAVGPLRHRPRPPRLRRPAPLVGHRPRRVLDGRRRRDRVCAGAPGPTVAAPAGDERPHAGRPVVPRRHAQLRRARRRPGHAGERSATRSSSSPAARRGPSRRSPRAELAEQVARCAAGLRRLGVGRGDRVAAYAPNIPETLVALLATASLGAVWSSCAPEFGTRSVIDRFGQIEPSVLLAVDGYRYGDKQIDRTTEVDTVRAALPSVEHVVGVRYLGTGARRLGRPPRRPRPRAARVRRRPVRPSALRPVLLGHDRAAEADRARPRRHHRRAPQGPRPPPRPRPRRPLHLVHDDGLDDVELPRVRAAASAPTIVLFDGDPGHPDLSTLWDLAHDTGCTVFGASAPLPHGVPQGRARARAPAPLRQVGSTGSPLPGRRLPLGARRRRRRRAGELDLRRHRRRAPPSSACRRSRRCGPARSAAGSSAATSRPSTPTAGRARPASRASSSSRRPMPSMPVGFWGDDAGRSRERAAYYSDFPGVWRHGDWVTFQADGACEITGRSDATLNRGGVRLGTADFYAVVEAEPEIADSLVVHLDDDGRDELRLYVQLVAGRRARRRPPQAHRRRAAGRVVAPPRARRHRRGAGRAPDPVGQEARGPGQADPDGRPPTQAASRGSLADPDALTWFEARAARRS